MNSIGSNYWLTEKGLILLHNISSVDPYMYVMACVFDQASFMDTLGMHVFPRPPCPQLVSPSKKPMACVLGGRYDAASKFWLRMRKNISKALDLALTKTQHVKVRKIWFDRVLTRLLE